MGDKQGESVFGDGFNSRLSQNEELLTAGL
jgi:hypothetical protein